MTLSSPPRTAPAPGGATRGLPRGCFVALGVVGALGVLAVLAVVALVVLVARSEQPKDVPPTFEPASDLPRSAAPLPDGDLVFDSDRTGSFELFAMAADGTGVRQLTDDPEWDSWWPKPSPDRRTLLFQRTPAGTHDRDYTATGIWAVAADGSGEPVALRPAGLDGWVQQGHVEWAPDGESLVLFGGSRASPQIQITDPLGRSPRAVTDRPGVNLDPVFTPDGEAVVFVGCPGRFCTPSDYELYRVPVDGGEPTRLTRDDLRDHDPAFSPDGQTLAWLTQIEPGVPGTWDIRIGGPDAEGARRLVGEGPVNSKPAWTTDGGAIVFHRIGGDGRGFQIWAIDPDGSNLRQLTTDQPGTNEYPAA